MIVIRNHGSIVLFEPCDAAAEEWLRDAVDEEAIWLSGALAVESRFAPNLRDAAHAAGVLDADPDVACPRDGGRTLRRSTNPHRRTP